MRHTDLVFFYRTRRATPSSRGMLRIDIMLGTNTTVVFYHPFIVLYFIVERERYITMIGKIMKGKNIVAICDYYNQVQEVV